MDVDDNVPTKHASECFSTVFTHDSQGLDPQSGPITAELYDMCQEAYAVMTEGIASSIDKTTLDKELSAYVAWCRVPMQDMLLYTLTNPQEYLPRHVCPHLWEILAGLQRGPYKTRKLHSLMGRDAKQLAEYEGKLDMQLVSLISQLARMRDIRSMPPWIVQRSVHRLWCGTNSKDWEMMTMERLTCSKKATQKALYECRDWLPEPFDDEDDVVSTEYAIFIHDNKEWKLIDGNKWERCKEGSKDILKTPLYHTVTGHTHHPTRPNFIAHVPCAHFAAPQL